MAPEILFTPPRRAIFLCHYQNRAEASGKGHWRGVIPYRCFRNTVYTILQDFTSINQKKFVHFGETDAQESIVHLRRRRAYRCLTLPLLAVPVGGISWSLWLFRACSTRFLEDWRVQL
jgi:hypothetical protein